MLWRSIDPLIRAALKEDLGKRGDITTSSTIDSSAAGSANLLAKANGVIAGLPVFERVFQKIDKRICCQFAVSDGGAVRTGDSIGNVSGTLANILTGERIALNFLQRLSGIATEARRYTEAVSGTGAVILDTRKTLPGYRWLDKYAVRLGGAQNHRFGLYDMVMIKDNHVDSAGTITAAVEQCLRRLKNQKIPIEVETRTLKEVREAAGLPIQRIMLDNMPPATMVKAVKLIKGRMETEASGNVTLKNVRKIAETGVDYISIGALTHSVEALDISLDVSPAY